MLCSRRKPWRQRDVSALPPDTSSCRHCRSGSTRAASNRSVLGPTAVRVLSARHVELMVHGSLYANGVNVWHGRGGARQSSPVLMCNLATAATVSKLYRMSYIFTLYVLFWQAFNKIILYLCTYSKMIITIPIIRKVIELHIFYNVTLVPFQWFWKWFLTNA